MENRITGRGDRHSSRSRQRSAGGVISRSITGKYRGVHADEREGEGAGWPRSASQLAAGKLGCWDGTHPRAEEVDLRREDLVLQHAVA